MNAMAPCPKDSAIMQTWELYKASDEYKNSHSWATRFIPDTFMIVFAFVPPPWNTTIAGRRRARSALTGGRWSR